MVQEVREIVLNPDELAEAIDIYRQLTPEFLPPGRIVQCRATKSRTVTVSVEIIRDGFKRVADFSIGQAQILRPLIGFCLKKGIPLPKDGQKEAMIAANIVVLYVTRNVNVELPPWTLAMRLDQVKSVEDLLPGDLTQRSSYQ